MTIINVGRESARWEKRIRTTRVLQLLSNLVTIIVGIVVVFYAYTDIGVSSNRGRG